MSRRLLVVVMAACGEHGSSAFDAPGGGEGTVVPVRVGRICESALAVADPTAIAEPALDCPERQCLHVKDQPSDLCTAPCTTAADCVGVPESPCAVGFQCVAPVDTGPFSCRKSCVCTSVIPAGGFPVGCP